MTLQIDSILSDPSKGVEYLLSRHIGVSFVSRLVSDFLTRRAQDVGWLKHCLTTARDAYSPVPTFGGFQGQPPIGQNEHSHMKAYHDEVTKGRFKYAPDGRVDCVICLNQTRFGFPCQS